MAGMRIGQAFVEASPLSFRSPLLAAVVSSSIHVHSNIDNLGICHPVRDLRRCRTRAQGPLSGRLSIRTEALQDADANTTGCTFESLSDSQQQMMRDYVDLLLSWNERMNLTAVSSPGEAMSRHVADSLALLPLLEGPSFGAGRGGAVAAAPGTEVSENVGAAPPCRSLRLIDVGTGAGLPGIVIAAARPAWRVTLLDSLRKRCDFLEAAVRALRLRNATVVCARAEDAARMEEHREAYDVAVARAVAAMRVLSELCLPFVKVGGRFVAAKGPEPQAEVEAALPAVALLGGAPPSIYAVSLPSSPAVRTAVLVPKVAPSASRFPRRPGMPAKRPL